MSRPAYSVYDWEFDCEALSKVIEVYFGGNVKALAKKAGINYSTLRNWANGQTAPRCDALAQLSVGVGVPMGKFMRRVNTED